MACGWGEVVGVTAPNLLGAVAARSRSVRWRSRCGRTLGCDRRTRLGCAASGLEFQHHAPELFRTLEFRSLIDRLPPPSGEQSPVPQAQEPAATLLPPGGGQLPLFAPEATAPVPANPPSTQGHLVSGEAELRALVKKLSGAPQLSFDTESTGIDPVSADIPASAINPTQTAMLIL